MVIIHGDDDQTITVEVHHDAPGVLGVVGGRGKAMLHWPWSRLLFGLRSAGRRIAAWIATKAPLQTP